MVREVVPRRSRALAILAVALLVILAMMASMDLRPTGQVMGESYSFSLTEERVNVTVLKDGSVDIDYYFHFTNVGFLDGVDVGLPNDQYDLSSANAEVIVEGVSVPSGQFYLEISPYIAVGVAVQFLPVLTNAISSAGAFELFFHINNPQMVYLNEKVNDTVGVSFRPTWFDPNYQVGSTALLESRMMFPQGFENESQALFLESNPYDSRTSRKLYSWKATPMTTCTWTILPDCWWPHGPMLMSTPRPSPKVNTM
jgi:hypothetical protein